MRIITGMAALLSLLLTIGCASAGSSGGSIDRNRITAEQLARSTAQNAYEVIRALEPQWFEIRGSTGLSGTSMPGSTATVFLDGSRAGELEYLRTVPLEMVAELRYWPPREANAQFGGGYPRGVIQIISKK